LGRDRGTATDRKNNSRRPQHHSRCQSGVSGRRRTLDRTAALATRPPADCRSRRVRFRFRSADFANWPRNFATVLFVTFRYVPLSMQPAKRLWLAPSTDAEAIRYLEVGERWTNEEEKPTKPCGTR
jgi:hypothetical protein